jgi:hypothetical protein
MKKKEHWPVLMATYLQSVRHQPFAWGSFDCCMFAADCVVAMTGTDPAAAFRERYNSASTAALALRNYAGAGLIATMDKIAEAHGWQKVDNVLRLQRGDVVLGSPAVLGGDHGLEATVGICAGTISLFVGDKGLIGVSTIETPGLPANVLCGWRIKAARD